MELNFKNPILKSTVEGHDEMLENIVNAVRDNKRTAISFETMTFNIPLGYFVSLCEYIEMGECMFGEDTTLDLTYSTVKNLMPILGLQYFDYVWQKKADKEYAAKIAKKTLASYLLFLCMNEHMCFPTIYTLENIKAIMDTASVLGKRPDDSWMGFRIEVGTDEELDLLKEIGDAVRVNEKGSFIILVDNVVKAYKRMCGVDLYEYGIEDFELADE